MIQPPRIKHRSGFTLVEILIVVGIFAVLSTVGLISIRNSKNKNNLLYGLGYLAGGASRVQGYTRAGRSVDRTPPAGAVSVPRSYGISVNGDINHFTKFTIFADFPPIGFDATLVPHCYAGGGVTGCESPDPMFPKNDTLVEDNIFMNNLRISAIQVDVAGVSTTVNRFDLVYVVPTAETILYYQDPDPASPTFNTMIRYAGTAETIRGVVSLTNPASNESRSLTMTGGLIGGSVTY